MAKTMLGNLQAIVQNTLTDSIKMIDIDELHESADNFFVVDRVEEFADTILGQGGVKDNLIVRPLESGGYEIISGHRRRAAVQHLLDRGENISRYLPCLVQNYSDDDARLLDIVLMNVSARQISDTEMWQSYELLDRILKAKQSNGERFGRIREKLAELLGVSAAQIGKMENVAHNAIPEVVEAVQSGELSISTANEIAKMDEAEQEKLVEQGVSNVSHKEIKQKNQAAKSQYVQWDGEQDAEIIKDALLSFLSKEELEQAAHMNNGDFTELIRKAHRNHGTNSNSHGVLVTGHFDKITVSMYETVYTMTWSMAARHIRAWIAEKEADERATCSTLPEEDAPEEDAEERATCSTVPEDDAPEEDAEERATCSTLPEEDAPEEDAEECATYSTVPEVDAPKDDAEERATCSTSPITEKLTHFIHEHYYDLETIFTTYVSMADDEEEIKLIEDFQELLRQSKEAERNKVRFGL